MVFFTYFLVFFRFAKNVILEAFVYNLDKYYGRPRWGRGVRWRG